MDIFDIVVFAALLSIGCVAGRITEKRHFASIRRREKALADVLIFTNRFPPSLQNTHAAELVSGSVVISEDYFKRALASLQSLFGGRLKSYESLLDRARREAVLRMKQAAHGYGAHMIINVKFQTFSIPGRQPNSIGAVEILAYGTALK
jgi:uncharacterized protein YbjQ (UPF0145 family)